jgi:hypothetical protein
VSKRGKAWGIAGIRGKRDCDISAILLPRGYILILYRSLNRALTLPFLSPLPYPGRAVQLPEDDEEGGGEEETAVCASWRPCPLTQSMTDHDPKGTVCLFLPLGNPC